jgi:hypothetical protein
MRAQTNTAKANWMNPGLMAFPTARHNASAMSKTRRALVGTTPNFMNETRTHHVAVCKRFNDVTRNAPQCVSQRRCEAGSRLGGTAASAAAA